MKKITLRKLQLSRTTIRTLSTPDLENVVGGGGGWGLTNACLVRSAGNQYSCGVTCNQASGTCTQ